MDTLDLWILELFAIYAMDGRTNGQTKAMLIALFHTGRGIITVAMMCRWRELYTTVEKSDRESIDHSFFQGRPDHS